MAWNLSSRKYKKNLPQKNENQSSCMRNNIWTYQTLSFSFSHPVSLALSQGVIILNGAPCYAISAVTHQRKWIIENMIFWSGGVKESFPPPAVLSPAVHWSAGSLSQSQSLRDRTTPLQYSKLWSPRHLFRSLKHFYLPQSTSLWQSWHPPPSPNQIKKNKTPSIWLSREQKKRKKAKERDVYIREKKKHGACGYNYTQAAQW